MVKLRLVVSCDQYYEGEGRLVVFQLWVCR